MRRLLVIVIAFAQIAFAAPALVAPRPALATQGAPCVPNPGKDGAAGTLSGRYNTYYQPPYGTLAAGATEVNLGAIDTAGGGAATAVAAGDELLIIQMQDGSLDTDNSAAYGSGGASGSGQLSQGSAGLYEYVYVSSIVGTVAAIVGAGSGGGLLNTYTEAAATGASGQKTYQIIRVPQFTTATLSSNFVAAYWDGKTGGVAALDLNSTLNLGGASVYADGDGFRGGAVTVAGSSPAGVLNDDYVDSASMNGAGAPAFGAKGEGILGTPGNVFYYTNFTAPQTPKAPTAIASETDGYPSGDQGRGAPGNAGGGGTDDDPAANDQNSGGGGGANGGAGGNGGYPWTSSYNGNTAQYSVTHVHAAANYSATNGHDIGGRGGAAQTPSIARVFMGGGGGAGVNNNGTNDNTYNAYGSSGGVGGGIIMLRLATTTGTAATLYANGTVGLAPQNDGGGGGGAGGTIVVTSPDVLTGITANVDGAGGTTAWATQANLPNQHGPGGGGGGGAIFASSGITTSAAGGAAGTTTTSATTYGAQPGQAGIVNTGINPADVPGVASGGECTSTTNAMYVGPNGDPTATGSYDGVIADNNLNDFTARAFFPAGAVIYNSGTTPGAWTGNTIAQGPTAVEVPNEFQYQNTTSQTKTITIYAHAPAAPAGWTVQLCPDNGTNTPPAGCAANGAWGTPTAAGSTASVTYAVPRRSTTTGEFWAVYSAPAGTVGYTRYDATIVATDGAANQNQTHNELYAGFVVLTKSQAVVSSGCTMQTPPPSGFCSGAVVLYEIDYRNIVAGGASEPTDAAALLETGPGSLVITENGNATGLVNTTNGASGQANQWGTDSNGLLYALAGGVTCPTLTPPYAGTAMGDSTAGSVLTGGTAGSTSFTDQVGGSSFQLVPQGISGTWQGTVCFEVTMK
ncbi:MAG TPA: hypothetical protein VMA36_03790 [Candidatus Limnocylindria bacterium]|nr:hypothetical protein [Candidatus Limnocylindria bacterium]